MYSGNSSKLRGRSCRGTGKLAQHAAIVLFALTTVATHYARVRTVLLLLLLLEESKSHTVEPAEEELREEKKTTILRVCAC